MSLMSAAYKVHYIIQNSVPAPFAVDLANFHMINNNLHQKGFHKIFRFYVLLSLTIFFIPTLILRIIWLFWHWKSFTFHHVDQTIVYVFFLAAVSICLPAYYLGHSSFEIKFMLNQRLKIEPQVTSYSSRFSTPLLPQLMLVGRFSLMDFFLYGLSSTFIILIFGVVTLPFAISYEPIQFVLGSSTIFVKIFSSIM